MTFWALFFLVLRRKPAVALAVIYWRITRRRLRAANRLRRAAANLPAVYSAWIKRIEHSAVRNANIERLPHEWSHKPRFGIVVYYRSDNWDKLQRTVRSVQAQIYPLWDIIIPISKLDSPLPKSFESLRLSFILPATNDLGGILSAAAYESDGEYLIALRAGDELSPAALFWAAEAMQNDAAAAVIYGDHDELDNRGKRKHPWFKPAWNSEMFLALDYISPAVLLKSDLIRTLSSDGTKTLDELLLKATGTGPVMHVPRILCHIGTPRHDNVERAEIVARYVEPRGAKAVLGPLGTVKVEWPLPTVRPMVSVIVPTRDKLPLLRACVESVLERTDYSPFEVIIVDNGSIEAGSREYLQLVEQDPRVTVFRYDYPYNYSAINNFAARYARGEYLCLLNNDTEVLHGTWLTEMMRFAVRSDVGAVGAKLLYPDRSIQHAGVIVGMAGAAGHPHRFTDSEGPGYFRQTHVAHFVSAVTAACLVVAKQKFFAVGGLDEIRFPVAYNDVDLCLKLQREGWRNVYTPHAQLRHYESRSRGADMSKENMPRYMRELKALQEQWATENYSDPLHNPNLDRNSEAFVVRL